MFYKKGVQLKIPQNSQENTCAGDSFLKKLQPWGLPGASSCEFYEIFKEHCFLQNTSERLLL